MSKLYGIVFFLLVADYASSTLHPYVYEFGQNSGSVLYKYDGTIPLLQPVTRKDIAVPPGSTVTYVRVTVNAISPPKVDYESDTQRVTIAYDWTQISYSTYSIVAKGKRVSGDNLSYVYVGMVPAFEPHYNFNIQFRGLLREDAHTHFTYLRVHYANPMSKVNVSYNPRTSVLEFIVKYPFMSFPFGVEGYSTLPFNSRGAHDAKWGFTRAS